MIRVIRLRIAVFLIAFVLSLSGCTHLKKSFPGEEGEKGEGTGVSQVIYNFPDIPVPKELQVVPEKTFIYESANLRAGVLTLKGNVDIDSLQNYFKATMSKNGWRFVNSFRFKDIIMNYSKEDKTCTVRITRDSFTTHVEISVGPSGSQVVPLR